MKNDELFPLRVASGKRFCNRTKERKLLKELFEQKRPTVLISPRRYGKTSLAYKVTEESKYPFCAIDFLTIYDAESVCACIINSISELMAKIMPVNMKTVKLLEQCFHGVRISILSKFIEFEFVSPLEKTDPIRQVLEILKGLEILAGKLDKTVVVFIDEFQRVLEIERGDAIQGTIRSIAQTTKNIAFLFSGSSRHMLSQAFDDPNQPLYMMCEKIFLGRIAADDYVSYVQEAAMIRWSCKLDLIIIQRIVELAEEHPFYVNFLCSKLWQQDEPPTNITAIDYAWQECLLGEKRRLVEELDKLTTTQCLVLKAIAGTVNLTEPTAAVFLAKIKKSSGTVLPAIKSLEKKDMLYVDQHGVTRVLDPLMKYFLIADQGVIGD